MTDTMGMGDEFVFDMDEAVEPPERGPVPPGWYDVVLYEAKGDTVGQKNHKVCRVTFMVENNTEYDGRYIWDDWFMPNKAVQEPDKYQESLGYLQKKLEAFGMPSTGQIRFRPGELLGRRGTIEVGIRQDKQMDKETGKELRDANGVILLYPAKNVVRNYKAKSATGAQVPQAVSLASPTQPVPAPTPAPATPTVAAAPVAPAPAPQPAAEQAPVPVTAPQPAEAPGEAVPATAFRL